MVQVAGLFGFSSAALVRRT